MERSVAKTGVFWAGSGLQVLLSRNASAMGEISFELNRHHLTLSLSAFSRSMVLLPNTYCPPITSLRKLCYEQFLCV